MIPLKQAVLASSVLSGITQRIQQSQQMLATIQPLLPVGLRSQVQAGPVDENTWCLLVGNPAAANKLKLLTPHLTAALRQAGFVCEQVRIKVQKPGQ